MIKKIEISSLLFTILFLALTAFSATIQAAWLPIAILLGVGCVAVLIRYPHVWLAAVIISYFGFVGTNSKGLSTIDILYAAFLFGTLGIWFIWKVFVSETKIFRTTRDWFILLVVLFTILTNIYTAYEHGTTLLDWAREWVISILLLYYIPFREYFRDSRHFKFFQIGFACLIVLIVLSNLYLYYKIATGSEYAYQITGVRSGEQLVSLGILFGLSYFIHTKKLLVKTLAGMLSTIAIIGIIAGYTRSYWLSVISLLIIMTYYVNITQRRRIITMVGSVFMMAGILLFTVFGGLGDIILKVMAKRFLSTTNYKSDVALNERIYESRKVFKLVSQEPLQGYGYGTQYTYWDPYTNRSIKYSWIHNGYLSSVFKVGVPGTIVIFIFHLLFLYKGYSLMRELKRDKEGNREIIVYALPAFLGTLLLLVVSISSNQFHDRVGGMAFAICYSAIGIAEIRFKELKSKTEKSNFSSPTNLELPA